MAHNWLPTEHLWLESICEGLVEGEVLLVRGLPRWGLSTACQAVSEALGESAILLDGREVTEQNQRDFRDRLVLESERSHREDWLGPTHFRQLWSCDSAFSGRNSAFNTLSAAH